ncbi:hypothetical protein [Malaciobacter mytili]|uniref:hypothetical protein n=1 Tax=Malaciobacter mytili TaxID=603050 RepID=UPI00100B7CE0|nr:hypothetical protein [Malaciobacter mytili]
MKFNKYIALILLLGSLLISAISIIFYLYNQNIKIEKEENKLITVYIATKTLEKGTLIKEIHIKETKKRKKDILNIPLTKEEILNKYTNERIYENEVFLKIKIIDKIKEKPIVKNEFNFNSYNIPFELFNNPNYSLKINDTIDIISVYDKNHNKNYEQKIPKYSVQYIAKNINVLGFLIDGKKSKKAIEKKWVKKEKSNEEKEIEVKAQEILLDIKNQTLLLLIKDYNKGKQLWMVKTIKNKNIFEEKIKDEPINVHVKKFINKKKEIPIEKAIIEYKDNPKLNKIHTQKKVSSTPNKVKDKKIVSSTPKKVKDKKIVSSTPNKIEDKKIVSSIPNKIEDKKIVSSIPNKIEDKKIVSSTPNKIEDKKIVSSTPNKIEDKKIVSSTPNKIEDKKIISSMLNKGQVSPDLQDKKISDLSNICKKPDNTNLLLGVAEKFNIRKGPSMESLIITIRYKDSLFRYKQKTPNNWYELCNGFYIHQNVVEEISYQNALTYFKKVRKYEK